MEICRGCRSAPCYFEIHQLMAGRKARRCGGFSPLLGRRLFESPGIKGWAGLARLSLILQHIPKWGFATPPFFSALGLFPPEVAYSYAGERLLGRSDRCRVGKLLEQAQLSSDHTLLSKKAAQTARARGWGPEPGSPRLCDMVSPPRIWDLG